MRSVYRVRARTHDYYECSAVIHALDTATRRCTIDGVQPVSVLLDANAHAIILRKWAAAEMCVEMVCYLTNLMSTGSFVCHTERCGHSYVFTVLLASTVRYGLVYRDEHDTGTRFGASR
jgi:hypothetical protein